MAVPTFVDSVRYQASVEATSHTLPVPAGVQAGDQIVAVGATVGNVTATIGTASGVTSTWSCYVGDGNGGSASSPCSTSSKPAIWKHTGVAAYKTAVGDETSMTLNIGSQQFAAFVIFLVRGASSVQFGNWNTGLRCPPTPTESYARANGPQDMFVIDAAVRNNGRSGDFASYSLAKNYIKAQMAFSGSCNLALSYPARYTIKTITAYREVTAAETTYSGDETTVVYKNNYPVYDGQWTGPGWVFTGAYNRKCDVNAIGSSIQVACIA